MSSSVPKAHKNKQAKLYGGRVYKVNNNILKFVEWLD